VLVAKIEMKPAVDGGRRGYRFTGKLSVERLLTGVALDTRVMVVAPTGFDHDANAFEFAFEGLALAA
jgi:hypothetical protein